LGTMENLSDCLICGVPLAYRQEESMASCSLCGTESPTLVTCEAGHYVCDSCHSMRANDLIERICTASTLRDPFDLAIRLMEHPSLKMHGPEHHFLVPAVLLSVYYTLKNQSEKKEKAIARARQRSEKIPGGFCGFCGNCGAAVGTGIFVSIVLEANPLTDVSWSLCNRMTAQSLNLVADYGGPRCCKRDTYLSIQAAIEFSEKHLNLKFGRYPTPVCIFSNRNRECRREDCIFFGGE
jgi:hypothetical protein